MGRTYGYIRVSSSDKTKADSIWLCMNKVLLKIISSSTNYRAKIFCRPQYRTMLRQLKPGDILCVTSIDRLGRNYEEIQQQWRIITRDMKVDILVLDMPLLDTRRDKDLLGTFISDLVLQVLSFVAQKERENIRKTTSGRYCGRKDKWNPFWPRTKSTSFHVRTSISPVEKGRNNNSRGRKALWHATIDIPLSSCHICKESNITWAKKCTFLPCFFLALALKTELTENHSYFQ